MNEKLKALVEKRGAVSAQLGSILAGAENEVRALTDEEKGQFEKLEKELADIDATLDMEKRAAQAAAFSFSEFKSPSDNAASAENVPEERAGKDIVNDYIRGVEVRAGEMTTTSTGGIIPSDFSKDIISKTTELSGILNRVTVVNSTGEYKQIIADTENQISAGWTDEIGEITSSTAKFKTISIGHHKLTALAKVSLELINQNAFDIATEIENQMYRDFALKAETAIIKGDGSGKPTGLTTSGTVYTLPSATAITSGDIIQIFHALKSPYQQNAVWIMSNATLCAVRMLSDGAGRYIFHQSENLTTGYSGVILGKPVLVSEAMDNIGAEKIPILFGDFGRAYKVNINPEMSLQILNEKYSELGMKGVLAVMWLDGKPVNEEAYVTVKCAAAAPVTPPAGGGQGGDS